MLSTTAKLLLITLRACAEREEEHADGTRWGRIINISSQAGQMGDVMRASYAAAKAGLIGLTKATAREMAARLNRSVGPTHVVLPLGGIEEWNREGEVGHDPESLAIFFEELRTQLKPPVGVSETPAHINDAGFVDAVLAVFDDWTARGLVEPGRQADDNRMAAAASG